jgi:hypothetical protein
MPERVIRHGKVEPDEVQPELWNVLTEEQAAGSLPAGPIVVPLATWKDAGRGLPRAASPWACG